MVYVKAEKGMPMPIAIQKIKIKEFSGKVTLTGAAMKQAGDIQVLSSVINVRDNPTVVIRVE